MKHTARWVALEVRYFKKKVCKRLPRNTMLDPALCCSAIKVNTLVVGDVFLVDLSQ